MAVYAIADLHLSFGADKPMDVFSGWNDHAQRLEKNWRTLVEEGDTISIDIPNHTISLDVPEDVLAARKAAWVCPEPKVKTGYLARYAALVTSADQGAVLQGN